MSQYESLLIAYGMPAEDARFHAWNQDVLAFRNRELPSYGRRDENESEQETQ